MACSRAISPSGRCTSTRWPTSGPHSASRCAKSTVTTTRRCSTCLINCPSSGASPTALSPIPTKGKGCRLCVIARPGITACPMRRNMPAPCKSLTREVMVMSQLYDCRDAFATALEEIAVQDARICAVVNDSVGSSKVGNFGKRFPERLINVGIAEQTMVGLAAGLSNSGKIPFVCAASPFLTGRALEQIKADVAYSDTNVKLAGQSPGMAYGELGPTHHSIEDLAWMRAIANMTVIVPADPAETDQAVRVAASTHGPMFLRIGRMPVPVVHNEGYCFEIGKAARLREGEDLTLIANGVLVSRALQAADLLAHEGVQARVLNMSTVRPLDTEAVLAAAAETGSIVTVEEHTIYGGLGSAVAEVVVTDHPVPMRIMGVPGVFAPTGSAEWLLEHFGLTAEGIRDTALKLVAAKV